MFFYGTPHLGSLLGEELGKWCKSSLLSDVEIFNACTARRFESVSDLKTLREWVTYGIGETHDTFLVFTISWLFCHYDPVHIYASSLIHLAILPCLFFLGLVAYYLFTLVSLRRFIEPDSSNFFPFCCVFL